MDAETRREFKRIDDKMERYDKDSRQLVRVAESVRILAKKVDRFSLAVTGLATTVAADLLSHYIR